MSTRHAVAVATVVAGLLATGLPVTTASATSAAPVRPHHRSRLAPAAPAATPAAGGIVVRRDGRGRAHYLAPRSGRALRRGTSSSPAVAARDHLGRYASVFGVTGRQLRSDGVTALGRGRSVVRFQQTAAGLPVLGGQLSTVVDRTGGLLSVTGETSTRVLSSRYAVSAAAARARALRATARDQHLAVGRLKAGTAARWLYDASLFTGTAAPGGRSAWVVTVTAPGLLDVRELVVVDAGTGAVRLHLNQIERLDRVVCDARNRRNDDYVCKRGRYARTEGGGPSVVADVNQAYDNAKATSDFYATFGVDLTALIGSNLGDGKKIRSTVRVCPATGAECPYQNAFWDGKQMVYGSGFAVGDDVVAHELTHGVTQNTSGLVYWYQSGAINESMSDVFGELVDQSDGIGNDDPSVRWALGEDLSVGAARNMANPALFGQPDQVNGPRWLSDSDDNGEVHTNSGVGNKAAYLISDGTAAEPGGAFAGFAFPGLGTVATGQIYWITQNLLTPGADYADLADALYTACLTVGVPQASCDATVKGATAATRMQAPDLAAPSAPQGLVITGNDGSIRVRWSPPAAPGSAPVNSYVLVVTPAVDGENFVTLDLTPRNQVIQGLPPAKTFTFGLVAVSSHGNSPAAQQVLQGTRLSLQSAGSVVRGRRLSLRGVISTVADGHGIPGRVVTLRRRLPGQKAFHVVARTRTRPSGTYAFRIRPTRNARYRTTFDPASTALLGTHSNVRVVKVRRR